MCDHPAPGGEPLWRVLDDLTIFVSALPSAKEYRNRRLPRITQRFAAFRSGLKRIEVTGTCFALGYSREPPVFTRPGRTSIATKCARAARYTPKRLPSRRWVIAHRIDPRTTTRTRTIVGGVAHEHDFMSGLRFRHLSICQNPVSG